VVFLEKSALVPRLAVVAAFGMTPRARHAAAETAVVGGIEEAPANLHLFGTLVGHQLDGRGRRGAERAIGGREVDGDDVVAGTAVHIGGVLVGGERDRAG